MGWAAVAVMALQVVAGNRQENAVNEANRTNLAIQTALQDQQVAAREKQRLTDLNRAIGSRIAQGGASGISVFEGSPLAVINEDIRRASDETRQDLFAAKVNTLTTEFEGLQRLGNLKRKNRISLIESGINAAGNAPQSDIN